jgi:hypothetical protein
MQRERLEAVRERLRRAWSSRRVCGLFAVAGAFRVGRLIALQDAGRGDPETLLRLALETEAVVLCVAPVADVTGYRRVSL